MNQSWIENVLYESRLKDEKIMQLEIKILKTAMIIEGQESDNDSSPLDVEETDSSIVQPNSLTHTATQHDLCQPNLNVGLNFADSYSCLQIPVLIRPLGI